MLPATVQAQGTKHDQKIEVGLGAYGRNKMHLKKMIAAAAVTVMFSQGALAKDSYTLSVTLDTSPQHVRNVWMEEFAHAVEKSSNGRLKLKIYGAASKYKDSEAAAAVAQGAIDIAVPQYQLMSRFIPDADFEQLPMFYGVGRDKVYSIIDGPLGAELNKRIETKLHVKVLGRPIDLGYGSVFSTDKPLMVPEDLKGLKIRVPGGPTTIKRYDIMGTAPVQIAWPDVPQALQTGTISALWTSHESLASAKLWDAGVRYGMNDRQAIVQYLPIMNQGSFDKLPHDLQLVLTKTWDEMVDGERKMAADDQAKAQEINASHGIKTSEPTKAQLAPTRTKLLAAQPALVKQLGMDADYIQRIQKQLSE
jgi:TRAP-type transport system periplasmic protein